MTKEKLDLSPLEKAIIQLQQSLNYYHSKNVQQDPGLVLQLRAAAIQAFEFTYELSLKMLRRYLQMAESNPNEIQTMSFPDLIRLGCDRGLLQSELVIWKVFRQDRGITSHTYDEAKAKEVFEKIPTFLKEAEFLLAALREHIIKL